MTDAELTPDSLHPAGRLLVAFLPRSLMTAKLMFRWLFFKWRIVALNLPRQTLRMEAWCGPMSPVAARKDVGSS
ncbi:hypothetical protein G6321_00044385 [Bradyrhizobium barranii subsp. barranii]|uniref:Uncharacterized protein n=1 Tax=Bradyrhizobium barranii subsp. barranii TaxID=2823807 RepID=A0A7Z0QBH1_9BRAD|nr:hypothetical protein [Bradyrhizobium barranii]UGX92620.1 hypothetical protein G6321_00044385 [Bradyrhizobium barranii subsp. barranii]